MNPLSAAAATTNPCSGAQRRSASLLSWLQMGRVYSHTEALSRHRRCAPKLTGTPDPLCLPRPARVPVLAWVTRCACMGVVTISRRYWLAVCIAGAGLRACASCGGSGYGAGCKAKQRLLHSAQFT